MREVRPKNKQFFPPPVPDCRESISPAAHYTFRGLAFSGADINNGGRFLGAERSRELQLSSAPLPPLTFGSLNSSLAGDCWLDMTCTSHIADGVISLCQTAADANRRTPGRRGNIVHLSPSEGTEIMVVADLHGNRLNYEKLLRVAALDDHPHRHLVLQEVCHGGPQYPGDGGCMSHLLLEDCIRLKQTYPTRFHFLLSNHELAELGDYPIAKKRKMLNLLFRHGITEMYGCRGERVRQAYLDFLASCPLAIKLSTGVFISHSCPEKCDQQPFDVSVFERSLTPADYRQGSAAFKLVWGRDFRRENAAAFAQQVGAKLLVHGHEPCSAGFSTPNDTQVILDGCCTAASYLMLPIDREVSQSQLVSYIYRLHEPRTASPAKACAPGSCGPAASSERTPELSQL